MCTVAITAADKITGVTRDSISTVNKAPLTTRGNNLLKHCNSLLRNARNLLWEDVYAQNQRHLAVDRFYERPDWKTALLLICGSIVVFPIYL